MFTVKELNCIDRRYFTVFQAGAFTVTLQSKNTKHCWHIYHQVYPGFTTCQIWHSHRYKTDYHHHGHAPTLRMAIASIKSHDTFQMNGRKYATSPVSLGAEVE